MRRVTAVIVLLAVVVVGCASRPSLEEVQQMATAIAPTVARTRIVTYTVTSPDPNARADIVLANGEGGTDQLESRLITVANPFEHTVVLRLGDVATLSAQHRSDLPDREITCAIRIGGETADQATSRGRYPVATCSALIGE